MADQGETTLAERRPKEQQALAPQSLTPAQMLSVAVQQDAPVEKIEKLMDLQQRWEANEARKAFEVAMVAFSARVPTIIKTRVVDFTTSKGRTHYTHAGLPETVEQIQDLMAECQLSRRWKDEEPKKPGNIRIRCIVSHVMGHSESFSAEAPPDESGNKNAAQAVASIITYLRRTTLFSVLGLVANDEVDDDGAGGKPIEPAKPQSQAAMDPAEAKARAEFRRIAEAKANGQMTGKALQTLLAKAMEASGKTTTAECAAYINGENVLVSADGTLAFVNESLSSSPSDTDSAGVPSDGQADFRQPGTDAQPAESAQKGLIGTVSCKFGHVVARKDVIACTLADPKRGQIGKCPVCSQQGKVIFITE